MKTQLTLKSFAELFLEKSTVSMPFPPPADRSQQKGLPAASQRHVQPITLSGAEKFAPVHLPNHAANGVAAWNHWGLNE